MCRKLFNVLLLFVVSGILGCLGNLKTPQLSKEDFNNLQDKKFVLTAVGVGHSSSNKGFLVKGVGVDNESLKKYALTTLPVDSMLNAIAGAYNISVDSSDFKAADLNSISKSSDTPSFYNDMKDVYLWQSNKSNSNSISIKYFLYERQTSGFGFDVYFKVYCDIVLTTQDGKRRIINLQNPDKSNIFYQPEKISKEKNIPVEEVTKLIIKDDLQQIPAKLKLLTN
jgi:hypothetical protein